MRNRSLAASPFPHDDRQSDAVSLRPSAENGKFFFFWTLLLAGCANAQDARLPRPPEPQREFRGAWVATVANINWPSKPGLDVPAQKAELLAILDTARDNNLNAIVFQVRPACDAFYRSDLEPWSEYLTGAMGRAPSPAYDPLEFAVQAAHRRGLQLHAWFNPFRALHHSAKSEPSANHISQTRPDVVRRYGNYLWLDPGEPAARDHSLRVILDVVRRYDIDGVHFDDYFYPYPEKDARGGHVAFLDGDAWSRYGAGLSRGDWRRQNVDDFVRAVQRAVRDEKPWVQFGISPFGIWRPGHPEPVRGLDAYDSLYADARKWLQEGWVDYLVPQLYWNIDSPGQPFAALLEWWKDQNRMHRHLWIGLNTGKVGEAWPADEILNQIKRTRQFGLHGHVHYNIGEFQRNPAFANRIRAACYAEQALPPSSPWMDSAPPPRPELGLRTEGVMRASWKAGPGEPIRLWLLQVRTDEGWNSFQLPGATTEHPLPASNARHVALRGMDRTGNLSPAAVLRVSD